MKIFQESKEESPSKESKLSEKQKTEETVLAAKLTKLCEQPLSSKKNLVYSSGQSKLLLNVYSNGSQKLKRKFQTQKQPGFVNKSVELGSMSSMSTLRTQTKSPGLKMRDVSRTSLRHESTILPKLVDVNKRKGGESQERAHSGKLVKEEKGYRDPMNYEDIYRREGRIFKKMAKVKNAELETSPYLMHNTKMKRTIAQPYFLPSIFGVIAQQIHHKK